MSFSPQDHYSDRFTLRTYDVTPERLATPASLFRFMQEVAIEHVKRLGLGLDDIAKQQRSWVVSQMLVQYQRFPALNETIIVDTWSNGVAGQFALREHRLTDTQGNILATASSHWLLLDQKNLKICRLSEIFPASDPERLESATGRRPKRVQTTSNWDTEINYSARYSELDFNGHVNHINYIEHALDNVPENIRKNTQLSELEIDFLQESKLNDSFCNTIAAQPNNEFLHVLFNNTIDKKAFAARSKWRDK